MKYTFIKYKIYNLFNLFITFLKKISHLSDHKGVDIFIFYENKVRKILYKITIKMNHNIHLLICLTGIIAIHVGWNMVQKLRPEKDQRKHPFIELYDDFINSSDNK